MAFKATPMLRLAAAAAFILSACSSNAFRQPSPPGEAQPASPSPSSSVLASPGASSSGSGSIDLSALTGRITFLEQHGRRLGGERGWIGIAQADDKPRERLRSCVVTGRA